jgi:hypothetical protein
MNSKSLIVLSLLFLSQMILSCNPCECDFKEYEITFNGVTLEAFDASGFVNEPVADEVDIQTFGLELRILFDQKRLAQSQPSSFGFSQAQACDCVPNSYTSDDEIVAVTILVQNTLDDQTFDVTENFESSYYGNPSMINFNELLLGYEGVLEELQFDMVSNASIPSNAIFIVEVELESGLVLSGSTVQITFVD